MTFFLHFCFVYILKHVAQDGLLVTENDLELLIFLPPPPTNWDYWVVFSYFKNDKVDSICKYKERNRRKKLSYNYLKK